MRAGRRLHHLPRLLRQPAVGVAAGPGPGAGPARHPAPRPPGLDDRPPPGRRRHPLRGRGGHGDDAGAALRRRGGGRARPAPVPPVGRRPPVRPGRGRGAGRAGRVLAPLRALRGRRPAGRRPPLRRRALRRRLRPGRRGSGRPGGHRGCRPAASRGHGQRGVGRGGVLRRRAGRVPPVHPARPASGASRCRTILRSGDHARIARWRHAEALRRTRDRRPDLLERRGLSDAERAMLEDGPRR